MWSICWVWESDLHQMVHTSQQLCVDGQPAVQLVTRLGD